MQAPRFLTSPWAGVVGAIVAALWESFWLVGPPVGIAVADRRSYLLWGLLALFVTVGQAFVTLIRRLQVLERRFDPKFEIQFLPENDENSPPYLEEREYVEAPTGAGAGATRKRMRKYRVGISNLSGAF